MTPILSLSFIYRERIPHTWGIAADETTDETNDEKTEETTEETADETTSMDEVDFDFVGGHCCDGEYSGLRGGSGARIAGSRRCSSIWNSQCNRKSRSFCI
ncbi:conserved protein of unknown function [Paenibacillus alvei]|uniref:Uncharacterized protein n=1 Tax=Paenibacillus alvei TaxID=44250 RepID=A0A383R8F1_PAEAL|nr:conserved protein of unknown function [Paenibacillus alvei]